MRCAARSRSASEWTMTPALPPSSSVTRFFGSRPFRYQPTSDDPVNEILRYRASRAIPSATLDDTGSTWYIPLGRSVSANSSARRMAPSGVAAAGLTTIGAPTARAGATLWATRLRGKLNGEIPRTGPNGNLRMMPRREPRDASVSRRITSSAPWRSTSEAHRKVDTALVASTFAHFSGLPPSRAISAALSSMLWARPREMWSRASVRACTGRNRLSPNVSSATFAASSTSASVGTPTSATTVPSYGLLTWRSPLPVRHSPFTRNVLVCIGLTSVLRGCAGAPEPPLVDRRHHVLDLGVVLERVHRHVLAVPALLVAPVRHLRRQPEVRVDPHRAELELAGRVQRSADVAGPHRRRETVHDVVRPPDGLVVVFEPLDRDHRPEHLALDDLVLLVDVGHDRGLVEVARAGHGLAAGEHVRPLLPGPVDEARDALALRVGDERPHLGLLLLRVAHNERLDRGDELREHGVVDLRSGHDAGGSGAVLSGVRVPGELQHLDQLGDVGVVEDHDRGLAAELQVDPLDRVGGFLRHELAGGRVAGDRDERNVRMAAQGGAHDRAAAGDDADHAGREDVVRQLGQPKRRLGRELRRLEDRHVPGRERRGHLPDGHHQG